MFQQTTNVTPFYVVMVQKETLCIRSTTTGMEQDGGFEFATHKITSC